MSEKNEKFELMKMDPNNIVELATWESKLTALVEENPFIKITDAETYKTAKKRRTALKSGRTEVQSQDGLIATFLRKFRTSLKDKSEKLVSIPKPHEDKQQVEIDRWEAILTEQREEKAREEQQRVDDINGEIESGKTILESYLDEMRFATKDQTIERCQKLIKNAKEFDFEEYKVLFDDMLKDFTNRLHEKVGQLNKDELVRIDNLRKERTWKIKSLELSCVKAISVLDINSMNTINDFIEKIEMDDYDFGDQKEKFDDMVSSIKDEASKKISKLKEDFEKDEELRKLKEANEKNQRISDQRHRLSNMREGYLDRIHQVGLEDTSDLQLIESTFQDKTGIEEELVPEFEQMVFIVGEALSAKLYWIKEEKSKFAKKKKSDINEFISKIKEIGFKKVRGVEGYEFEGEEISIQEIESFDDHEAKFAEYQLKVATIKEGQERQERLSSDKTLLNKYLTELEEYIFNKAIPFREEEVAKIYDIMKSEFLEAIDSCKEENKNL